MQVLTASVECALCPARHNAQVSVAAYISGRSVPSVFSLRLTSSRIETVNARLDQLLPTIESDLVHGSLVTVEDSRIRTRKLPLG
jgi:hypothetical protein